MEMPRSEFRTVGRDALHASQRCRDLVELKRDRGKETHAMRLYTLPRSGRFKLGQVKETHAMRLYQGGRQNARHRQCFSILYPALQISSCPAIVLANQQLVASAPGTGKHKRVSISSGRNAS